jgi:hypothetical protein
VILCKVCVFYDILYVICDTRVSIVVKIKYMDCSNMSNIYICGKLNFTTNHIFYHNGHTFLSKTQTLYIF